MKNQLWKSSVAISTVYFAMIIAMTIGCPDTCDCYVTDGSLGVSCTNEFGIPGGMPHNFTKFTFKYTGSTVTTLPPWFNDSVWHYLEELELQIEIEELSQDSLSGLNSLGRFHLQSSTLRILHPDTFKRTPNLVELHLTFCNFVSFSELGRAIVSIGQSFQILRTHFLGTSLQPTVLNVQFWSKLNTTNLKEFHIVDSNIAIVTDVERLNDFAPHLEVINISGSSFITMVGTFKVPSVRVLDLSRYNLPVNMYFHTGPQSTEARTEELWCKFLTEEFFLFPNLEVLILDELRFSDDPVITKNKYCNFGGNKIRKVSCRRCKFKIFDVEFLGWNRVEEMDLSYNLLEYINFYLIKSSPMLRKYNLSHNMLYKMQEAEDFEMMFSKNGELRYIDLSWNGLSFLPQNLFRSNRKLVYINLSHNKLTTICSLNYDQNMVHLTTFDLSHNAIGRLETCFVTLIQFIISDRSENGSTSLNLNLANNPIMCPCQTTEILTNFKHLSSVVTWEESVKCYLADGSNVFLTKLSSDVMEPQCTQRKNSRPWIIPVFIAIPSTILLLFLGIILVYFRRRNSHSDVELTLSQLRENNTTPDSLAFVSYSSADENIVLQEIVPGLETRLKEITNRQDDLIVIDDRNFRLGVHITMNVIESVVRSAVVIFIVSNHFLSSKWCEFEREVACLEGKPIIIVLLEQIDTKNLSRSSRKLFDKWTRIPWCGKDNEVFWSRLTSAIVSHSEVSRTDLSECSVSMNGQIHSKVDNNPL